MHEPVVGKSLPCAASPESIGSELTGCAPAGSAPPSGEAAASSQRDVLAEIHGIQQQVDAGQSQPPPADVGPFLPTGQPGNGRWFVVLGTAVTGAMVFAAASEHSLRASSSYLGGLAGAIAALEFGAFNIKVVDRVAPQFTLAAAMFSYLLTALVFALILAASSPRVVDGPAIAIGMGVGLTIWLGALVLASKVRLDRT